MHIDVLGAGPAGLFFSALIKRADPNHVVRVFEQNARDVTFGFGVVLSGRAMNFLSEGDPDIAARIAPMAETWADQRIVHRGQTIIVDGSAFSGIGRVSMLSILRDFALTAGVEIHYGVRAAPDQRLDCDLLVAADGANSSFRDAHTDAFGTRVNDLLNYYAWYGVEATYPSHTLTFQPYVEGAFCAHHYRYRDNMSTFVAEADPAAWNAAGFPAMDNDERRRFMEQFFSATLNGNPLIANGSFWRRWRLVTNDRWSHKNIVLIGDALRTAHPSIGSGTRLAMEDAIALSRALRAKGTDLAAGLASYERERKPIRERLNQAGLASIAWYEDMAARMRLESYDFAYDYLLRTGVMTEERLKRDAPDFMRRYRLFKNGETF
jgi:2-polyprenyl-6-methoxyphenol hydroxylase-like FAD-dependent oxidoreductase